MDEQRRKAVIRRADAAPAAGSSPSSSLLADLVRVLARHVARENFFARKQAAEEATSTPLVVHDPHGKFEKHP